MNCLKSLLRQIIMLIPTLLLLKPQKTNLLLLKLQPKQKPKDITKSYPSSKNHISIQTQ